jgi:hypothetical protein
MKASINIKTTETIVLELSREQFTKLIQVFDKISNDYACHLLDIPVMWREEDFDLANDVGYWLKMAQLKAKL